ncbi:MAG: flagellar filament capping protein FliD [Alphaproteobacteria bacterium]
MTTSINTSGISVDSSTGRVTLSGFASSIDTKAIIDAAITAKRIPAVKLETKITKNQSLIADYASLKTKMTSLTTALDKLRGSSSFLSDNVFKTKSASGATAAAVSAPSGYTPSDIGSLVSIAVTNTAQVATHTLNVQQLAKAHQVRSDSFTSTTAALSTLGVTAGSMTINGEVIAIDADDSLIDLRGKINAAGVGVTATVVSASATTNYLVLTSSETGVANAIDLSVGGTTSDTVGFTTSLPTTGTVKNPLVAAQDAIFDVDGITGVTRASNDVDDVIEGVTISLLKAEPDTDITLKIEPNLVGIKTAVSDLVTAYNDIREFYTEQRTASDRNDDGDVGTSEFGSLATDNTLRQIIDKLGQLAGGEVGSNTDGYRSLSQIGVTVNSSYELELDDATFDSKLITDVDSMRALFGFEFSSNDSRVAYLGRSDATQAGTYYLNIGGTDGDGNITSANLKATAGSGTGGADDGSLTLSGKQATAGSTSDAEGLILFFNGAASLGAVNDIEVTFSRGVADSFYDYFSELVSNNGTLDVRTQNLTTDNTDYQDEIDVLESRLETIRTSLERKYTAMETALARLESLKSTISSYFDTQNSSS